jgi:hypothetical protein
MEIHIPTPLRTYTERQETVSVHGATVAEGLAAGVATSGCPISDRSLVRSGLRSAEGRSEP